MGARKVEDLDVWQLCEEIRVLLAAQLESAPARKDFNFCNQILGAASRRGGRRERSSVTINGNRVENHRGNGREEPSWEWAWRTVVGTGVENHGGNVGEEPA